MQSRGVSQATGYRGIAGPLGALAAEGVDRSGARHLKIAEKLTEGRVRCRHAIRDGHPG